MLSLGRASPQCKFAACENSPDRKPSVYRCGGPSFPESQSAAGDAQAQAR